MKRKLIITLTIIGVLASAAIYDYVRSKMYTITVLSVSPNPSVADGRTPVQISIRLTNRHGEPVKGHDLFAFAKKGGSFKTNRVRTDEQGLANYTYFPFKVTRLIKIDNDMIEVVDESNSVFIEINTRASFEIQLVEPEEQGSGSTDLQSIFGE